MCLPMGRSMILRLPAKLEDAEGRAEKVGERVRTPVPTRIGTRTVGALNSAAAGPDQATDTAAKSTPESVSPGTTSLLELFRMAGPLLAVANGPASEARLGGAVKDALARPNRGRVAIFRITAWGR
jgi:hypothetical protein